MKVTREMIDEELVKRISRDLTWVVMPETISEILASLANNPIEPTNEQCNDLGEEWNADRLPYIDQRHFLKDCLRGFQRVAYLKKAEDIPPALKDLMSSPFDSGSFTECWEKRLLDAYKLGKESK